MCKPTLALDFDGVIHWYRNGWKGATVIDDDPVPGSLWFITTALKYFNIEIFSSRNFHEGGIEAMKAWMKEHGFPVDRLKFPKNKPAALLTIDDRAFRFEGVFPHPATLLGMKPWNR